MNETNLGQVLSEVYQVISQRKSVEKAGSYTTYLFKEGQDKILKKVGEEAAEVIIGSKNHDKSEIIYESADLLYHLLVLLCFHGIGLEEIARELAERR
ncbi:MAG: phosphoribosyl-ATP diphosphatase [Dehalobacterium sp.]